MLSYIEDTRLDTSAIDEWTTHVHVLGGGIQRSAQTAGGRRRAAKEYRALQIL